MTWEPKLPPIVDTVLHCPKCGAACRIVAGLFGAVPAIDAEGNYGCPVPDCGGILGPERYPTRPRS